jgi:5-methylcytosine-specific restriction endonuclease McrA
MRRLELTGKRFGRWCVLSLHTVRQYRTYWLCRCECGKEKVVNGFTLKNGKSKSCGCLQKEIASKPISMDRVKKIIGFHTGRKRSKETCKKISDARKNRDKQPNWNPFLTDVDRADRRWSVEYQLWRKLIFERDDYTCKRCGQTGVRLNGHHIEDYASAKDLRFDISNGITFCEKCHKAFHNLYGYGSNTTVQLNEFLT